MLQIKYIFYIQKEIQYHFTYFWSIYKLLNEQEHWNYKIIVAIMPMNEFL